MSLKAPLLIAAISIACIIFLFSLLSSLSFLLPVLLPPFPPSSKASSAGQSCLILSVDESKDDGLIRETLSSLGLGDFISESSQLVAIDDFGSMKYIPLGSFQNEIEVFDPRDDGYARKMSAFFVHDGKRFFFRLIDPESGIRAEKIKKQVGSLLENTPFTFVVLGPRGSNFLNITLRYAALIFAASCLALFASHHKRLYVFQFPVLLFFAPCGFYSLILAAILTGIWELLREPLGELSAAFRYKRRFRDYAGVGLKGIMERLKPFRANLLIVLFLLLFLAVFSFFGIISPFFLTVVLIIFTFLYFLSLKIESLRARKNRHILFTPVLLLPRKVRTFSFFPRLLPFTLMSLFALFLPQAVPERNPNPIDPGYLISQEEYNRHITFQHSFSYRPMAHESDGFEALNKMEYLGYYLGNDGLIAGSFNSRDEAEIPLFGAEPSFPLEKLMDFLIKYNKLTVGGDGIVSNPMDGMKELSGLSAVDKFKEFVSVAIIAVVCLLDYLRPLIAPKKKIPVPGDKRIAA